MIRLVPLLFALGASGDPDDRAGYLIKGGTVIVTPGRTVGGAAILVRGGKIEAVGKGEPAPPGVEVIELSKDAVVTAGFVDLHSHLGSEYEVEEGTEAVTPHVKAVEAFNTRHPDVRRALASGVTSVGLAPGNGNLVGGRVGVVKLNGGRYDQALYLDAVAMKLSLGSEALRRDREPTSRTGAMRMLRKLLGDEESELRKHPLLVHADSPAEIESALELRSAFDVNLILLHAGGIHRRAGRIEAPVALGPLTVNESRDRLETPARLAKRGVRLAFVSDAPRTSEAQLRVTAALAVRYGLSAKGALQALTVNPAAFLGLSDRIGTLETGKDADLVVFSGDPFSLSSAVELVMVNGSIVYRKPKP